MSFESCKKQYQIELRRGGEVEVIDTGKRGKIKSYRNYVRVAFDDGGSGDYHPFDLNYLYLSESTQQIQQRYDQRVEKFNERLKVSA